MSKVSLVGMVCAINTPVFTSTAGDCLSFIMYLDMVVSGGCFVPGSYSSRSGVCRAYL